MHMALHDITLSATESNWRLFMVRRADSAFLAFKEKILKRDGYTCQFCGFQAQQFQEVINIDGDYTSNRLSNMATACEFCAQCFFLEAIGNSDFGGGSLIYLPEMTQGELNALCHILFTAMVTGNSYSSQAKNTYRSLRLRTQQVEAELGDGMSNPALLGRLIIDANIDNLQEVKKEMMTHLRVLPSMTRFSKEIEAWALQGLSALNFT